ncbi:MAG: Rrf2 family transcriptional regulator [Phycisphaerae bacterium]|jgi:Rrf2 family protein
MFRTKASTYAILAVAEIAKRQVDGAGGVQAGEIARCLELPAAYAAKVLTQLARAGILRSDRGPRGGFRLLRPVESIVLLDIIEAVDGTIVAETGLGASQGEGNVAHGTLRGLDDIYDRIVEQVRASLRRTNIASLVEQPETVSTFVPVP